MVIRNNGFPRFVLCNLGALGPAPSNAFWLHPSQPLERLQGRRRLKCALRFAKNTCARALTCLQDRRSDTKTTVGDPTGMKQHLGPIMAASRRNGRRHPKSSDDSPVLVPTGVAETVEHGHGRRASTHTDARARQPHRQHPPTSSERRTEGLATALFYSCWWPGGHGQMTRRAYPTRKREPVERRGPDPRGPVRQKDFLSVRAKSGERVTR